MAAARLGLGQTDGRVAVSLNALSLQRGYYEQQLHQQVCVEPPPSAFNMTLPAFAAERGRLQHGARSHRLISAADAGAQQQTRRPQLLLSVDGTDRRTDRRTDARPLHRPR